MIIPNQEPSNSGSSSSESTSNHYDVFLNFTTESTFTAALCDALHKKGIDKIFVDPKKLRKRKRKRKRKQVSASPDSLRAIKKSKVYILVFSEDYASSADCLDELVKIMKCKRRKKRVVLPIFYKVEPTVVRHQKNVYGEAMDAHQRSFGHERVKKWKSALKKAANLSGWHFEQVSEYDFVEIVEAAFSKLPPKRLHIGEHIVGLKTCIKDVTSLLDTVSILGIHGTAGVGKTTLAKAAYNSIVRQFEEACFLPDIRKAPKGRKGMVRFQKTLLSEILDEKKKIELVSVDEGTSKIKQRLCHRRVLLVLDDVDERKQLKQLVGGCRDWCGNGSKVIVTTRNKKLLTDCHIDNEYGMKELNNDDSLELFSRYAFHLDKPPIEYEEMSKRLVCYAQGLPLALKEMGSKLNNKSMDAWTCALDQLERLPERKVEDVLRIMGSRMLDDS